EMTKRYLLLLAWLAVMGLPSVALPQPVGPHFHVNTYTTGNQNQPTVASDATGNFVVVWMSYRDGGGGRLGAYGVFGQRYDSSGNGLGGEFQVNSFTSNRQERPATASDATGKFVVVWDSDGQDGSQLSVFGQRYDSDG